MVSELRKKLLFTFGIFAVFRFGAHVSIPGVDVLTLKNFFASSQSGLLSYLNLFSGGALQQFSIFSLGIQPYISASIMMQLLTIMVPSLEQLSKEGEYGRRKIGQYTRCLTLGVSFFQGLALAMAIENQVGVVISPGWGFRLSAVLFLSVGSLLVMWLGEQINTHGIGNGSSMIIFAGIVTRFPYTVLQLVENIRMGQASALLIMFLAALTIAVIACVVFLEKGERKVPVQYAKRVVGNKMYGGQSSYIPLKLNPAGVVPVIFAQAFLGLPLTLAGLIAARWPSVTTLVNSWFSYDSLLYNVMSVGLIIFFAFIYTAIIFNPTELADNLRKSGGFIPGIRPGKRTADFFDYLLTRIGFPGAIYLALLSILPNVIKNAMNLPIIFSGISLLIVIGVALDTSAQIESHLIERKYEGFLSSGRLKARYNR